MAHSACFKIWLHALPRRNAHREGHREEAKQEWGKDVQVQNGAHDRATSPTKAHENRSMGHDAVHHFRGHDLRADAQGQCSCKALSHEDRNQARGEQCDLQSWRVQLKLEQEHAGEAGEKLSHEQPCHIAAGHHPNHFAKAQVHDSGDQHDQGHEPGRAGGGPAQRLPGKLDGEDLHPRRHGARHEELPEAGTGRRQLPEAQPELRRLAASWALVEGATLAQTATFGEVLEAEHQLRGEEEVQDSHEPARDRVGIQNQVVDFDELHGDLQHRGQSRPYSAAQGEASGDVEKDLTPPLHAHSVGDIDAG